MQDFRHSSGTVSFFGKAFLVNKEKEGAQRIAIVLVEAIISVYRPNKVHSNSKANTDVEIR